MNFHSGDYLPVGIETFLDHAILYQETSWTVGGRLIAFGNNLPDIFVNALRPSVIYSLTDSDKMSLSQFPTELESGDDIFYLDFLDGQNETMMYLYESGERVSFHPHDIMTDAQKIVYGRAIHQNGKIYLQYHFFYLINQWDGGHGVEYHEGDWEGMIIELDAQGIPLRATTSAHKPFSIFYKGGETRSWSNVEKIDTHPVVYIGKGGHPTYCQCCRYIA